MMNDVYINIFILLEVTCQTLDMCMIGKSTVTHTSFSKAFGRSGGNAGAVELGGTWGVRSQNLINVILMWLILLGSPSETLSQVHVRTHNSGELVESECRGNFVSSLSFRFVIIFMKLGCVLILSNLYITSICYA